MRHYANRKDDSQADIVEALRKAGASVCIMDHPLDLLVGIPGYTLLVECKMAKKRGWKDEKTEKQKKFLQSWKGQYAIVYTPDEALELIASYRRGQAGPYSLNWVNPSETLTPRPATS